MICILPKPAATVLLFAVLLAGSVSWAAAESAEQIGKLKFESYCSACHSLEPPPKLAPPVRGIVMHYRASCSTAAEFAAKVTAFVHSPDKTRSLFPEQTQKRFGLMPKLSSPDEEVNKIALWMWSEFN